MPIISYSFFLFSLSRHPRSHQYLSTTQVEVYGGHRPEKDAMTEEIPDYDRILRDAARGYTCPECGGPLNLRERPKSPYCSRLCSQRFRHRRRYAEHGDEQRARSLAHYHRNRDEIGRAHV